MLVIKPTLVVALAAFAIANSVVDARRAVDCDSQFSSDTSASTGADADVSDAAASTTDSTAASVAGSTSTDGSSATTLAVVEPVIDCADLLTVDLTDIGGSGSNITAAEVTTSDGISYCSVTGELPPAVGWQVMLPVSTWTQRYMQVGCGGLCGSISLSPGAAEGNEEVANGNFAYGGTDMDGGSDGVFGLEEDKRIAFAYLAQHQTAQVAKKLILAYYGQEQEYAYFNGCSDGGREAVMEAIRYPDDFDGIIAGAPAMLFTFQNSFHHGWLSVSNTNDAGELIVVADRLSIIHEAVVSACDALDGLEDGLLSDPRLCSFDVSSIECASDATDNSTCLTTAEVEAITKFYTGAVDPDSGYHLTVGEDMYGSELAWSGVFVGDSATSSIMSTNAALAAIKYLIFEDYPGDDYTLSDFVFDNATIELLRPRHALLDAVSPDLSAFYEAGRKLILWHGWADPHIPPRTTIAYHEALQTTMGEDVVDDFERLYLLPGVYHCSNGEGPSAIDFVTAMMQWVEAGVAPNEVIASSASTTDSGAGGFGQWSSASGSGMIPPSARRLAESDEASGSSGSSDSTVTRPVYPYPKVAKYIGTGDVNDAANFEAGDALYTNKTAYWLGQDFFNPYTPIEG